MLDVRGQYVFSQDTRETICQPKNCDDNGSLC